MKFDRLLGSEWTPTKTVCFSTGMHSFWGIRLQYLPIQQATQKAAAQLALLRKVRELRGTI